MTAAIVRLLPNDRRLLNRDRKEAVQMGAVQ